MLHRPQDRVLFVSPHAKMVDVDSIFLKEGQIGIYDTKDTSENGCKAVIDFTGKPRNDKRYEIRIGRNEQAASRSIYDKDFSTPLFSLNEITEIYASWPKKDHAYVDDVILGYNGVSDDTAFSVSKGDRIAIRLILAGRAFELLGYEGGRIEINDAILLDDCDNTPNQCEECDPCEEVDLLPAVLKCIERMKNQPIAGGGKVSDYIDITPVTRCTNEATEPETEDVNFYCMEVCDTGDDLALAEVRAQYPGLKIVRESINGSMSRYKVMKKGTKPNDYTQRLISIMKGCEECPPSYTEVKGGYLYSISLEDDGVDMSTTVESLPNVVADTVNKMSQIKGSGLYIAATSKKLTDEEISTFVEANPTAIIYCVAKTSDMCENPTVRTASWSACGSCKVSTEKYYITIPDDECGNSALEEIKQAFPELEITDYGTPAACQHSFQTTVYTNMLCDECDKVFEGFFTSKAPASYRNRMWKKLESAQELGTNCKCGIRFRGKEMLLSPSECLMDKMTYVEDSVEIVGASGGYPDSLDEGSPIWWDQLHFERLSSKAPRTHVGGNMMDDELKGYAHFNGFPKHQDFMGRTFMNEYSRVEQTAQYVDFQITINPHRYAQGFGKVIADDPVNLILRVRYGAHEGVQEMINMIGAAAGLGPAIVTEPK